MSISNSFFVSRCLVLVFVLLAVSGLPACAGDVDLTVEKYIASAKDYQDKGLGDCIDCDKLRLNHVLQIGNLAVKGMVVIDQAMTIILDADVVF